MTDSIVSTLARLDDAKSGKEVYTKKKQDLVNSVITDDIKQQIKDIEAEFAPDIERFDEVITALTDEVKEATIAHGSSVKGEYMKSTFVKGRVTWDSKGLEGYAVANPDVLMFKKTGNPSARIGNI